jgi:phospholipase/carboxylesterase
VRNPNSIVIQAPSRADQLILLFHGVGASPDGMAPLGRRLASAFPLSAVINIPSPYPSQKPGGHDWFSVAGITEANRADRVRQAMPAFLSEIGAWQRFVDVAPMRTALVGFSQGAMMSLEASVLSSSPARWVVAIGGRFARLPHRAPSHTTIHFVHGEDDSVISCRHVVEAAQRLRDLGGDVTADVTPFAGHSISGEMAGLVVNRLRGPGS